MDISAIAIQGLQQADAQLTNAAEAIAAAGGGSPDAPSLDTVSLSAEVVALSTARLDFAANLKVLQTADSIQKNTINLTA